MGAEKRKRKEKNGMRILEREVERGGYEEESRERLGRWRKERRILD